MSSELGKIFDLCTKSRITDHCLQFYLSEEPIDELKDYVGLYLKEGEILSEALVRKIDNFFKISYIRSFDTNGQILNFENVGSDASKFLLENHTEYYTILADTLMGYMLEHSLN